MAAPKKSPEDVIAEARANLTRAQAPGSGVSPEVVASMQQGLAVMEHRQSQQDSDDDSAERGRHADAINKLGAWHWRRHGNIKKVLDQKLELSHRDIGGSAQQAGGLAGIVNGLLHLPLEIGLGVGKFVNWRTHKNLSDQFKEAAMVIHSRLKVTAENLRPYGVRTQRWALARALNQH